MSDAEMATLLKAIEKIDKKIEWREKRISTDREDIARLVGERDALADRYRELNLARMDAEDDADG